MNRLSKWLLGTGLVLMLILVSACSSDKDQPAQPPAASENTTGTSTDAQPGGTGTTTPEPGSDTGTAGSTDSSSGTNGTSPSPDSSSGAADGTVNPGSGTGSTDAGNDKGTSNNANPELTPETKELKISSVQQGPGQLFLRVESLPQGYKVSNMEWQSDNSNETASFEQAVQNGKNGKDGFFASSDQRNFGFIYNQSHSGEQGKVTLTLQNEAGDELTWYEDVTLQ